LKWEGKDSEKSMVRDGEGMEGREMGTHEKIAPKRNTSGIWGCLLGTCHALLQNAILCLYREPFKSSGTSNLTILKKSPQKFNIF